MWIRSLPLDWTRKRRRRIACAGVVAGVAFLMLPARSEASALTVDCAYQTPSNPFCTMLDSARTLDVESGGAVASDGLGLHLADLGIGSHVSDVLAALATGQLRVALAVDSLNTTEQAAALQSTTAAAQTASPTPVPEPASLLLFGSGLAGLAGLARRLRRKMRQ